MSAQKPKEEFLVFWGQLRLLSPMAVHDHPRHPNRLWHGQWGRLGR